jgi:hypothetical protein
MGLEFKNKELTEFQDKIDKESCDLINKIIKEYCPISVGEEIKTLWGEVEEWMVVTKIDLMAINSWNYPGERLSFEYKGIPLKKIRIPMKNRKSKWFGCFEKDGKIYNTPSYSRIIIIPARMFHPSKSLQL